jgi:rubredoxin
MANYDQMWQCQTANCGYIYDPDRGDKKARFPKGRSLKTCRMIGNARCAVPAKRCSNGWGPSRGRR